MPRDLRQLAAGQHCYGRLHGICNYDAATVVLAHIRRGNIAGIGEKPCDIAALPLCARCHDAVDGRMKVQMSRSEMDSDILRGLLQWQSYLWRQEYVIAVVA